MREKEAILLHLKEPVHTILGIYPYSAKAVSFQKHVLHAQKLQDAWLR